MMSRREINRLYPILGILINIYVIDNWYKTIGSCVNIWQFEFCPEINIAFLYNYLFLESGNSLVEPGYFFQDFNLKLQLPYSSSMWMYVLDCCLAIHAL